VWKIGRLGQQYMATLRDIVYENVREGELYAWIRNKVLLNRPVYVCYNLCS